MKSGNGVFSFFMAVGNILGYAAGSAPTLYKVLPLSHTTACDVYCANLKTCFLIDILLLASVVLVTLVAVKEPKIDEILDDGIPLGSQIKTAFRNLGKPMWCLFLVTAFNWVAWFPFLMFNTDWVGLRWRSTGKWRTKELIQHGSENRGSLGLMLTAATLGCMSLGIDSLSNCWVVLDILLGIFNFILAATLASTLPLTKAARNARKHVPLYHPPPPSIKSGTLALFAASGIPQAVCIHPSTHCTIFTDVLLWLLCTHPNLVPDMGFHKG